MKMIEHVRLTPSTPCANLECVNQVGEGSFSLARLKTGKNVGNGSGNLMLLLCTPCLYALEEALAGG